MAGTENSRYEVLIAQVAVFLLVKTQVQDLTLPPILPVVWIGGAVIMFWAGHSND